MKLHTTYKLLMGLCLAALSGPLSGRAATTTVNILNFAFQPPSVTIQPGDTVMWVNQDFYHHTSTSGTSPTADGIWDSGQLLQLGTFSRVFTNAGTFPYYCVYHPYMTATVIVQAAGNSPPSVALTSPTNGATLISPADVTVEASASDTDGTVAQVAFFDGTNSLGVASASPYTVAVTLYAGSHSLTAVATDNLGAVTTSTPVAVTVATEPLPDPVLPRIAKGDVTIELQPVLTGLTAPLGLAVPDDGSRRLFVYDQVGLAWVVTNGTGALPTPLLDVRDRLVTQGNYDERGLLGLATHPNFALHPLVYTFTSEPTGATADFVSVMPAGVTNNHQSVIAEWTIDPAQPNLLNPASRRELLRIDKPQANHNGGTLRFGPDGFLYVSLGDGGQANDVANGHVAGGNAQHLGRVWGKLLRIDVDSFNSTNGQYGIPIDNPFVGQDAIPEIYAYGLRNPYTYSFDSVTGKLYLGDAGQNKVEEVNLIVKGGNYGWNVKEGSLWFDSVTTNIGKVVTGPVRPVPPNLVDPIAEYGHEDGSVVIGGFVYHGTQVPALQGQYVFGDWGSFAKPSARLFHLRLGSTNGLIQEMHIGLADRPAGFWLRGFGQDADGELYVFGSTHLGPNGTTGTMQKIVSVPSLTYVERKLVSDIPGKAEQTDPNLVNPWGIAFSPTGPFWVSDNHAGVTSLYDNNGLPLSLVVAIPSPAGGSAPGAPTGVVFNNTSDFQVEPGQPAHFIYATEDGTIVGWNSGSNAVITADNSASGAIYKGLALGSSDGSNYLYAANFNAGSVDVFDASFNLMTWTNAFADPTIPDGFAPFNVQNVGGQLLVTYAMQDADKHDDVSGPGNGYVNVFDTSGHLVKRFASNGSLNSPWGIALAPAGFGGFSQALLIGNFGDGRINAFEPDTGQFLGMLQNGSGVPISIQGLWGLSFGNGGRGGDSHTLYFTAGIAGGGSVEDHGLFGSIAATVPTLTRIVDQGPATTLNWAGGVGPYLVQKKSSLSDANWWNLLTTTNRSVTVAKEGEGGFFRIVNETPTTVLPFTVLLNGAAESPAVLTPATGLGTLAIESNVLTYHITYAGLSAAATAAHVHGFAAATNSTGVLFPVDGASGTAGVLSGSHAVTDAQVQDILNGLAYVNIHTATHGGGEIRGQIVPLQFTATLNGAAEVPPVTTSATGTASLTMIGSDVLYVVSYSGLAGTATGAHIHGPADPTQPAPVLVPLTSPTGTNGTIAGTVSLTPEQLADLLGGMTYINVHSTAHGGGEIRGQITR